MKCPECPFEARSRAGLATHQRKAHVEQTEEPGPNEKAIEVTLAELRRMGRLERIDEARVQALRSMARALDSNPFNSQMWREYREAIGELTVDDSGDDSDADELIRALSPPVRDPA